MNAPEDLTSTGTHLNPWELAQEDTLNVFRKYNFTRAYIPKLPISAHRDRILNMIEANPVVVIQGTTGSGKTTQVPQFIMEQCAQMSKHCNIVVTQPRRIAAISIANRVCAERNWTIGGLVGYQVGMEIRASTTETRLLYCTTGVLLNKLVQAKHMNNYTHVIIDEVHERDQETDFVMLAVRKFLRTNSKSCKVVLMSASMDAELYSEYFSMPTCGILEPAPVITIEGPPFKVDEYYIEELTLLGQLPELNPDRPKATKEALHIAYGLIKYFDRIERQEQNAGGEFAPDRGSVLVFLPGIDEINSLHTVLNNDALKFKWSVFPLHSSITLEEQGKVFEPPKPSCRKIILSTNIAESSITVPDVKYVVDFCLTKSLVCDANSNYTSLQLEWASKSNCIQRKGRAGRVGPGRVYRMVSTKFYEVHLPRYPVPEIKRCPREQLVLKCKQLDLGEPKAVLALAIEPPNLQDIERAVLTLKEVWALTTLMNGKFNPYDGNLTCVGRIIADLPLDVHLGKLIALGHVFGCLEDCIIIAAGMSLQSIFSRPFGENLKAYKSKLAWSDGSFSDCMAIINAYKVWQFRKTNNYFSRPGGLSEAQWANMNFIQLKRMKEAEKLVVELTERLKRMNIKHFEHREQKNRKEHREERNRRGHHALILKLIIAGAFYPHYFRQEPLDEQEITRFMSGKDPQTTVMVKGLPLNEGVLYTKAIEALFHDYGKEITIHFEDTKAYIEFGRGQARESMEKCSFASQVLPEVYQAIKMRLSRMPLELFRLPPEETKRRMEKVTKVAHTFTDWSGKLRSNRISTVSSKPLTQVELPGLYMSVIEIYVSEVIDCGHFWAHYCDENTLFNHKRLQALVEENVEANPDPIATPLRIGMLCLAQYTDPIDGLPIYYRAIVREFNDTTVQVVYVDYGNVATVEKTSLRFIDSDNFPELTSIPAQAFECVLSEIKPNPEFGPEGKWCMAAQQYFFNAANGKRLFGRVYSVVHDVVHLELMVNSNYSISYELLRKEWAVPAEESYLSKQNNEIRMKANAVSDSATSSAAVIELQNTGSITIKSTEDFVSLGKPSGTHKIYLQGPFSPLEMKFVNLIRTGYACIRIEQDSVNSIALDSEPQDTRQRLLVAGHVGMNTTGDTLLARNTTLMPNIHGLLAVTAMVFAPFSELRADPDRTRYTGVLCGLGCDPDTGKSTYPEHDMEIAFDTEISHMDMILVNVIRYGINVILGTNCELREMDLAIIIDNQQRARRQLLDLICKKKASVAPYLQTRMANKWRLVNPKHELIPKLEQKKGVKMDLDVLPLLNGIELEKDTGIESDSSMMRTSSCSSITSSISHMEM